MSNNCRFSSSFFIDPAYVRKKSPLDLISGLWICNANPFLFQNWMPLHCTSTSRPIKPFHRKNVRSSHWSWRNVSSGFDTSRWWIVSLPSSNKRLNSPSVAVMSPILPDGPRFWSNGARLMSFSSVPPRWKEVMSALQFFSEISRMSAGWRFIFFSKLKPLILIVSPVTSVLWIVFWSSGRGS